jgi:hypothetical protein
VNAESTARPSPPTVSMGVSSTNRSAMKSDGSSMSSPASLSSLTV